jgi:hypothetical protein
MSVSRYVVPMLLCAALAGTAVTCASAAGAQQPDTSVQRPDVDAQRADESNPGGAPTLSGSSTPVPGPDSRSAPARPPKDIVIGNPCKAQNAPSYCNVRN